MARETKTKVIDGYEYICTQFPPQKSLRVLTKLTKYLGGPLGELMKSADPKKGIMDQDTDALDIGGALRALGEGMGEDDLYILASDVCESVVLNKAKKNDLTGQLTSTIFDDHFMGSDGIKRLFLVLVFALEVNFGNFLGEAVARASSARAAT